MKILQGKWDTAKLRYGQACMLEKKGKYFTEISINITTFNDKKIRLYPM